MKPAHLSLIALACLAVLAGGLLGCAGTDHRTHEVAKRPCPVDKLALAPFQTPWPSDRPLEVLCPISGDLFPEAVIPEAARVELTGALPRAVEKAFHCPLVLPSAVAGALPVRPGRSGQAVRAALARAARKVGAQTIIAGTVFRYRERVGTGAGIKEPASVYLNLYAIEARTGTIIGQGSFRETQQSLSENLFKMGDFFERGGRWLTAAELSEAGMVKLLSRMALTAGE